MLFCFLTAARREAYAENDRAVSVMVSDRVALVKDHEHLWSRGICQICRKVCPHESHDMNGICSMCGRKTYHKYEYGICRCGKPLEFSEELLPEEYYFEECEEPGTLYPVTLSGRMSEKSPTIAEKKFEVYLPYTYDNRRPYDVMFLQGGLGSPANACTSNMWWLTEDYDEQFCFKTIWDHMMMNGDCEPMIIVSVDGYSAKHGAARYLDYYEETAYFVKNYIYPYVVENFSTYAASSSPEDIIAARDHFGYGGYSNGGYMSYWGGMKTLLDYCANFMPIAGSWRAPMVADDLYYYREMYPIICFVSGAGKEDGYAYWETLEDYSTIVRGSGYLMEGENCWFIESDYAHDWCAGSILFYNGLRLMFPNSV